ncbi:MAG: glutamine-hydrolyzing carbamoyl-phosphate synthase small subunit [Desulfosudaceae bacterium]
MKALLALEDGRIFPCQCFTRGGEAWGEVVFNTSMTGYQEILTDPSYRGQMVTMTYPLIGNYGVNPEDVESDRVQAAALITRAYQSHPSNYRATASLAEYLDDQGVLGITELDTRALTRHIREAGAMRGYLSTRDLDPDSLVDRARQTPAMAGRNLVGEVTTARPYFWVAGRPVPCAAGLAEMGAAAWTRAEGRQAVVVLDYGVKYNILRCLAAAGCEVLVVPAETDAATIRRLAPDGIFLSNGPGDPEPLTGQVAVIKELLGFRPMFGICLGNQLLGLALGGRTYKLKFGHRGANQPAKNLAAGRVEITSQNHGFAVNTDSLDTSCIDITHINLNDQTFEGIRHQDLRAFAVQYHPEAAPGPHDARYLFDEFVTLMKESRPEG